MNQSKPTQQPPTQVRSDPIQDGKGRNRSKPEATEIIEAPVYLGLAYYSYSMSERSKRWYYIAKLINAEGCWFEIGRIAINLATSQHSQPETRKIAKEQKLFLLPGVFYKEHGKTTMTWKLKASGTP